MVIVLAAFGLHLLEEISNNLPLHHVFTIIVVTINLDFAVEPLVVAFVVLILVAPGIDFVVKLAIRRVLVGGECPVLVSRVRARGAGLSALLISLREPVKVTWATVTVNSAEAE